MKNRSTIYVRSLLLLCWGLTASSSCFAQVFVNTNATGTNDGSSWVNAYTDLQVALTNTLNGEIWVARGTYRPVNCNPCGQNDKETAFRLPPDVQLYGGFAGTENTRSERNWSVNLTILNGDTGIRGDSTDNVYNVVIAENATANTILDGFIIEEGNADGSFGFSAGGGLLMDANPGGTADMQVRNCTFRNNYGGGGGALAIDCVLGGSSEALIYNCLFEGNTASLRVVSTGAAVFIQGNAGATIKTKFIKCTFQNNYCGNDGGAFSATPTGDGTLLAIQLDSCRFSNNRAADRGGAIWYRMSSRGQSAVSIKNSQFISNIAGGQGGAIFARSSFDNVANDTLLNCFFSNNQATGNSDFNEGEGGAVHLRGSQDGIRTHYIINCVFDRNFASDRGGAISSTSFFSGAGECNTSLINCTFFENKTNGEGGALHIEGEPGISNNLLINNIFWNDSTATAKNELFNKGGNIGAINNDFDGGIPAGVTDGGSNLNVYPQFADPSMGDLRLLATSPLINAGINDPIVAFTETDLDGDPRIHSGTVDLGAYEIGVIYVDLTATAGRQNGRSWQDAFLRFQDALEVAKAGDQIWVARGTYFPTTCRTCTEEDQKIAMRLIPNVAAYGGFRGVEVQLEQRDWTSNPTILSGDIGVTNDSTDNSYNVLIAENATVHTILDGFIIEEGNADGSFGFSAGGGLLMDANPGGRADMQVRNCTFRNNYGGGGGALAIDCVLGGHSQALIYNCTFEENTASLRVVSTGAAVFIQGNSGAVIQPRFVKCTFQNNFCGNDGGAFSATPTGAGTFMAFEIDSCTFTNNRASDRGAAIWYRMSSEGSSAVVIKNSAFISNTAGGQGGAIYARSSFDNTANDTIINCLFRENVSDGSNAINEGEGGAIFLRGSQNATRNQHIINCVFDRNFASERGGAIASSSFVSDGGTCIASIINSTFFGNTTNGDGGAIHTEGSQGVNELTIYNSVLWENNADANANGNELFNNGASLSVAHSNITDGLPENVTDLGNNLSQDPQFQDPPNGNLDISACSPLIDAGNNNFLPNDEIDIDQDSLTNEPIGIDLLGEKRIHNEIVDIGAYEWNGDPPALSIRIDSSEVNCNGLCTASASIDLQGGVPEYRFLWSDGQNTATAQGLCAGTYYLTVSDNANCLLVDSVTIKELPLLEAKVNSDTTICQGESILLNSEASGGAGSYTFLWDNDLGQGATQMVAPTQNTVYSVMVTDSNNCEVEKSVSVSVVPLPSIELNGIFELCPGLSTSIDAGSFASYLWSNGATTQQISLDEAGIYGVSVVDENGCMADTSFEITATDDPEVIIFGDLFVCEGVTTTLDAGPFESYLWSTGDTTAQITVSSAGTYQVSVSDANGCSGTGEITVGNLDPPDLSIIGNPVFCLGDQASLTASEGFFSYLWSTGETSQEIIIDQPGIYEVSVVDDFGCIADTSFEITATENPEVIIFGDLFICEGITSTLDAGPFESYVWSTGDTSAQITVGSAGTYQVSVSDANGCTGTGEITIGNLDPPDLSITGSSSFCLGDLATLTASEGFFSYLWSTGETSQEIIIDQPGIYEVSVVDDFGCIADTSFEITATEGLEVIIAGDAFLCEGLTTTLDAGLFESYLWSTGDTSAQIDINSPGSYQVSVSDANGCAGTGEITIEKRDPPNPDITGNTSFCLGGRASLKAPDGFLSYRWSNGSTEPELMTNQIGMITLEVTDEFGCIGITSVEISDDGQAPKVRFDTANLTVTCRQNCLTLSPKIEDSGDYSVDWSSESGLFAAPPNALTVEVCRGDTYFVKVTDKINACITKDTVEVLEDKTAPIIDPIENLPSFGCITEKIDLVATVQGSLSTIQWSTEDGGAITPSTGSLAVAIDAPGTYLLEVQSTNGCLANRSFTIPSEIILPVVNAGNDINITCGESRQLDGRLSQQGSDFSSTWSSDEGQEILNANSLTPEISAPGFYILAIQNLSNGCTAFDTVQVTLQYPEDADAGVDFSTCDNRVDLSANLPAGTEGIWTSTGPGVTVSPNSNQSEVTGLSPGDQIFTWTLSAPGCPNYSSDDITISFFAPPKANNDLLTIASGEDRSRVVDLTLNDQLPQNGLWDITLLNPPSIGNIDGIVNGQLSYSVPKGAFGETTVGYRLCSLDCPDSCSEANIRISVEQEKITAADVPNAITPNGDGNNETFVIDLLEVNPPDRFPDNELIIFNRWGDIVFQQKNYDNSWNGVNQKGEPLPTGTYYYILRLDLEDGNIIKGDITIIR